MFTCHVCGSHEAEKKLVSETFTVNGETVLVDHIPAKVCEQCGEIIFDIDTAEHVRLMLRDTSHPSRRITIPVFEFA
jgi:YgiT-type zinc finger domain-containing protein